MTLTRAQILLSQRNRENASRKHFDTPTKARIRQSYQDFKKYHPYGPIRGDHTVRSLYTELNVSKTSFYFHNRTVQAEQSDRTHHNQLDVKEQRGRPRKITPTEIHEMERYIEESDAIGRAVSWETLGYEVGLEDVSARTIQRAMGRLDYHKCVACTKSWIGSTLAQKRCDHATLMLQRYPFKSDWYHVRFSDEVHFGLGPMGKLMIIRRPGERYCINCIQ